MNILSFDCETSGLPPSWQTPYTDPSQPRLVELGLVLGDTDGREHACAKLVIRPDGWAITEGAQGIHGISLEHAERVGVPVTEALAVMMRLLDQARALVAHSLEFDTKIINREMHLIAPTPKHSPSWWGRGRLYRCCTMLLGKAALNRSSVSLAELHEELLGEPLVRAGRHDALDDARGAFRCFVELHRRGATGIQR